MNRHAKKLLCLLASALILAVPSRSVFGQQQYKGVCASVKIQILQELTLERIGFEAKLEITNNDGVDPITDFSADLTFENPLLSTNGTVDDASSLFFVRAPELENISDVAGTGVIGPTKTAVIRWFIIPKIKAGGSSPNGVRYKVGARLTGKFNGQVMPDDVLRVFPDTIFVRPEPQLEITYFQPRDVQGDDPFTDTVESPIPFTLGVLVKNSGYGVARKVKINSQQPKIIENKTDLLLIAQLLGVRVMDSPLERASLLVNLGDLQPSQTKKGAWDMITSLSGTFVEFKASYTHASELGGEETSVIKSLDAHFIAHEVMNDQAGRDDVRDFLADTDRDANRIPDTLYESEGNVIPVNYLQNASIEENEGDYTVTVNSDREGWGYIRLNDPAQAKLDIARVVRSDGKILNTNNFWSNLRYEKPSNKKLTFLHILDLVGLGEFTYTVAYAQPEEDTTPPETTINFAGSVVEAEGKYYITPETQVYFLSEDESPVSMYYSITNSVFLPAVPFSVRGPGEYPIEFYAEDSSGNRETNHTAVLVVAGGELALSGVNVSSAPMVMAGDALSVRADNIGIAFRAQESPTRVDAFIDIYRGIIARPTIGNVPSSPTRDGAASLVVAGPHVDYYSYRLDGGGWSEERPVSRVIELTDLSPGIHTVEVLGRSEHSGYPDQTNSVTVDWRVDPNAAPTLITNAPATPTREGNAVLAIGGEGVTDYRWTIDDGYFRAETPVAEPLILTNLMPGEHVISVLGKTNGVLQPTNQPTIVKWTIDPGYGSDFSALESVRSVAFTNVAGRDINYKWDGRNDQGVIAPPGWYTVRVKLQDELGNFDFETHKVRISEFLGGSKAIAEYNRGPRNPHARGHWVVWQDQSSGNWDIYARDINNDPAQPPVQLTGSPLTQQNPQTDGRYVVWQGRQINGNWDVYIRDLESATGSEAVTSTTGLDEVNPSIDWPWLVYQVRPAGDENFPWRLNYYNLDNNEQGLVSTSAQEQLTPKVQAGRVVWQDHRDQGHGEIYFKDLETGESRRLTTNTFGQYHPAVFDNWVVWQDNRHGQVDLYGYDLSRNREVRLTDTPENETRPSMDGPWVVCEEDSAGVAESNLRLMHLPSLRMMPLTRSASLKALPSLTAGWVVWQDTRTNTTKVAAAQVPALQAVFQNRNAVVVTETLSANSSTAFDLLRLWHEQADVNRITRFRTLTPDLEAQTAYWSQGRAMGDNFDIVPGEFLWIAFDARMVLDLGAQSVEKIDIPAGTSALSYAHFPSGYGAFKLLEQLGLERVKAIRMLDAESGRWLVAEVRDGRPIGHDFRIPKVAVVLINTSEPINQWQPE
ncbi:MAG: hypothetical protein K9N52_08865 [Verrucomicrobia bacterium]|nr:hypothetical protein [Verrucomicrobiota bacterium]